MSCVEAILSAYRRAMDRHGEPVTLRRGSGATALAVVVRARIAGYQPSELIGGITQAERKFVILAEDLASTSFAAGPLKGDRILFRGQPMNVEAVDDGTARVAGVQIAFLGRAKG